MKDYPNIRPHVAKAYEDIRSSILGINVSSEQLNAAKKRAARLVRKEQNRKFSKRGDSSCSLKE